MIQQIQDVPKNMVAFRSTGEVTMDDFKMVHDEVEKLIDKTDKLNYLLCMDNSVADFTAGAWMQDALLGIRNLTKWNRAAIVSDSETISKFTDAFSKIMPGEFRGFAKEELQQAINWTSEQTN